MEAARLTKMSDVARLVTCALCGTRMAADTEVCPKCGSLNAHLSYHTQFGALEAGEEALVSSAPAGAPALPSGSAPATSPPVAQPAGVPGPPAQEPTAVRHRPRIAAQSEPGRQPQAPGESPTGPGETASATAWQYSPIPSPRAATLSDASEAEHNRANPPRPPVERPALPAWSGPTVRDPDVELSGSWREGMARIPYRPLPPQRVNTSVADPNTASVLEMFGFFGFLGLGHWYGGHVGRGLLLMVGWWVVLATMVFPLLQGLNPLTLIITIFIILIGPLASGYWISSDLKRNRRIGK
jgi:hypothetical protein